jgi:hypothetical protein
MLRGSVLAVALVFSAPVTWQAVVDHSVGIDAAILRFLIAVPAAAALLALLRAATAKRDTTRPTDNLD